MTPAGWGAVLAYDINHHGIILAYAKRTLDAQGQPIPPAQQISEPVLLVPYYLAQAEGENAGKSLLNGAPVYEPNDGIGNGEPIYHPIETNIRLTFSSISASMIDTITFSPWGSSVILTETGPNTLVFENTAQGITVGLTQAPMLDNGVLERLTVIIDSRQHNLNAAKYSLVETSASSNVFEDGLLSVMLKADQISSTAPNTVELTLRDDMRSASIVLMETGIGTGIYTDSTTTITLNATAGGAFQSGGSQAMVTVTSAAFDLQDTRLNLPQEAGETVYYRNQPAPTPTDAEPSILPDFAKWKIKLGIAPAIAEALGFVLKTSESEQTPAFDSQPDANGFYQSSNSYAVVPHTITAAAVDGAQALKVRVNSVDWSSAVGSIQLALGTVGNKIVAATEKAQLQAVVLQSIDLGPWERLTFGTNTKGRIATPLEKLGYTVYLDEKATTTQTLTDYAKGKQIWYSLSHGTTYDQSPYTDFTGINFYDAAKEGTITTNRLKALNLNYALVMVDGCVSAQSSKSSPAEAIQSNTLTSAAAAFANAFGPKVAYLGWGWETNPASQELTGKFVARLKGNPTVGSAYDEYIRREIVSTPGAPLLKLYGNRNNKIDKNIK